MNNKQKIGRHILYHGDCFDVFPDIPNSSIDLIVCDLPYGITANKWDIPIPLDLLWVEYNRIIKNNGAILLFGNQPFTSQLVISNPKMFRYTLCWVKNKSSDFLNANRKPLKIHEDICVFYKKQPTYNPQYTNGSPYISYNLPGAVSKQTNYGTHKSNIVINNGKRNPTTVLYFNRHERPVHPTQKPVDLLEWLIKTYSNEDDVVLDNCMGVGSTGVACINCNRKFIGIEKEKQYFDIAYNRMNNN